MDRDHTLKITKDKEREAEDLCYQLSLARYSSLTAETPSSLVVMTHEGMSGTHDLRKEPFVTIPHEEHSELQVLEERYDAKGFDYAPDLHCGNCYPPSCTKMDLQLSHQILSKKLLKIQKFRSPAGQFDHLFSHFHPPAGHCNKTRLA
jgi:hypothetical protein